MTLDELLASGRHVVTFAAGAATSFGLLSVSQSADIATDVNHIFNGVKEIAVGAGPLLGIVMAWWATHKSTPAAQVAAVSANPEVKAITVSNPDLAVAARTADPQTQVSVVPHA